MRFIFFSFIADTPLTSPPTIPFCDLLAIESAETTADFLATTEEPDEASPLTIGVCVEVVADIFSAFFDLLSEKSQVGKRVINNNRIETTPSMRLIWPKTSSPFLTCSPLLARLSINRRTKDAVDWATITSPHIKQRAPSTIRRFMRFKCKALPQLFLSYLLVKE